MTLINVISTQDVTIFPEEMIRLHVEVSEEVPEEYYAVLSPLPSLPKGLRISIPTVFRKNFEISVANFNEGQYWDGITGDLYGNVYDIDDEELMKGFFGKDERYSIPYDIKKGDIIAVAELIKNGKQKRGGENND